MSNISKIKADLERKLLEQKDSPADFEKTAALLKSITDIEKNGADVLKSKADTLKSNIERDNLRKTAATENAKTIISALTPILGFATILVGLFQIYNNQKAQQENIENTEWRTLLTSMESVNVNPNDTVNKYHPFKNTIIPIQLESFFASESYGKRSKRLAVKYMSNLTDIKTFSKVFNELYKNTKTNDFENIVEIDRGLKAAYTSNEEDQKKCSEMDTVTEAGKKRKATRYSDDSLAMDIIRQEAKLVGNNLIKFIKENPGRLNYDFSDCMFCENDFSKFNFRNSTLNNVYFTSCILDSADLGQADYFYGSTWSNTRWWNVARISDTVLSTLSEYVKPDPQFIIGVNKVDSTRYSYWCNILMEHRKKSAGK